MQHEQKVNELRMDPIKSGEMWILKQLPNHRLKGDGNGVDHKKCRGSLEAKPFLR